MLVVVHVQTKKVQDESTQPQPCTTIAYSSGHETKYDKWKIRTMCRQHSSRGTFVLEDTVHVLMLRITVQDGHWSSHRGKYDSRHCPKPCQAITTCTRTIAADLDIFQGPLLTTGYHKRGRNRISNPLWITLFSHETGIERGFYLWVQVSNCGPLWA